MNRFVIFLVGWFLIPTPGSRAEPVFQAGSAVVDVPAAAAVVPEAPACAGLPAVPGSSVVLLLPYACASHLRWLCRHSFRFSPLPDV